MHFHFHQFICKLIHGLDFIFIFYRFIYLEISHSFSALIILLQVFFHKLCRIQDEVQFKSRKSCIRIPFNFFLLISFSNVNRFLHEKREALDAIELLKLFAKHKGISVDISHDVKTNDFCNFPSPSEPEPTTPIDKSNTDANSAMDERNANDIEVIVSNAKNTTSASDTATNITIDDSATVINQPKPAAVGNGNLYTTRNELIGMKKSATDI